LTFFENLLTFFKHLDLEFSLESFSVVPELPQESFSILRIKKKLISFAYDHNTYPKKRPGIGTGSVFGIGLINPLMGFL